MAHKQVICVVKYSTDTLATGMIRALDGQSQDFFTILRVACNLELISGVFHHAMTDHSC